MVAALMDKVQRRFSFPNAPGSVEKNGQEGRRTGIGGKMLLYGSKGALSSAKYGVGTGAGNDGDRELDFVVVVAQQGTRGYPVDMVYTLEGGDGRHELLAQLFKQLSDRCKTHDVRVWEHIVSARSLLSRLRRSGLTY